MVLIGSNDRGLYALNETTGKLIWRYLPAGGNGGFFNDPAVGNGVLYVGSNSSIIALDTSSGKLLWSYTIGTIFLSSVVVDNGMVYVGSSNMNFYAFHLPWSI
jgi:outer membrane protein assembly factor BamB